MNNPIIFIDPDGRKVKPASKAAFNVLLNTINPESREKVILGNDGFVQITGTGEGANFDALRQLVEDENITEIVISENFEYLDPNGKKQTGSLGSIDNRSEIDILFEAYDGAITKEDLKAQGFSDEQNDNGKLGITLLPGEEKNTEGDGRGSVNGNIIIIINSGQTDRNKARTTAHEGYGHALFFILGKDPNHGQNKSEDNKELEDQIRRAVNEAATNYDKSN
ncbi:hypothetical protein MY04_3216 [Flammeovirga sp. MY04]|uniref:hypothetical protein n=1 Tax=Flammeovirga sp. MY04 TaxID=1191459 RepID=UPI000806442F|nr:hypothetical protein [Flammeovirga sp. MY04]ANQ50581.1 hypothetical protein MY04_3216 [Flammeovirga sp. MY04]